MRALPKTVLQLVANAEYYLEASYKHPTPTKNAVQLLLLLIGWENIVTAKEEIDAWAKDSDVDPKVYNSHERKFQDIPSISRIQIGENGEAVETVFSTPVEFRKLRLMCQYGLDKGTKDIKDIFKSGWHFDKLTHSLSSKIGWAKVAIAAVIAIDKR